MPLITHTIMSVSDFAPGAYPRFRGLRRRAASRVAFTKGAPAATVPSRRMAPGGRTTRRRARARRFAARRFGFATSVGRGGGGGGGGGSSSAAGGVPPKSPRRASIRGAFDSHLRVRVKFVRARSFRCNKFYVSFLISFVTTPTSSLLRT